MLKIIFVTITLACSTLLYAQPTTHSIFNYTDSTTVTGKIDGYSTSQEQQFVNYYTYDITGKQTKYSTPIQKGGKFSFSFMQQYEGDFAMQYGANFIKAYAVPGEHIEIDIDINVADKVFHFPGAFKFKGRSSVITEHMLKFFAIYLPMMDERGLDINLSIDSFIDVAHRNLESDLRILNKYIEKNNPPELFRIWTTNWIKYEAAGYILIKPFLGRGQKPRTDSLLIQYLRTIQVNNEEALNNAAYYSFLSRFTQDLQMMINNRTSYSSYSNANLPDSIRKLLPDSILKKFSNTIPRESPLAIIQAMDLIDKYMSGIFREIGYYSLYSFNTYSEATAYKSDQVWDRFDESIKDNFLQQVLEEKRNNSLKTFTPYNVIEKIEQLKLDASLKKNLLTVLQKEKGKYVYIDFWGSWCKPCMAEMPYYKAFIEEMKNEPVSFLFLSVETSQMDTKKTKEKYDIPGTFVTLNKNDTDIANYAFGFSSYPSHFFIDPNGNLVTGKLMININDQRAAAAQLKRYMK